MALITDSDSLARVCRALADTPFVTVDTEFMRERTYWPVLCLIQLGGPDEAVAVDPLAPDIDLSPLFELMVNSAVTKVFHAARQDIEIFLRLTDQIPHPLFDTQVAAMVCGFGDSVAYDTLVERIAGRKIDKSSRFTNWMQRPLSQKQLDYALSDVIHLRPVYTHLHARLEETGRTDWVREEMELLCRPDTYRPDPQEAWKRLKARSSNPRFLAVLSELAAWREREAQKRDVPRSRVLRDEALMEVAATAPAAVEDLYQTRSIGRSLADGPIGRALVEAVARAKALPKTEWPSRPARYDGAPGRGSVTELLRVLLKLRCEEHQVAQKLIVKAGDLEQIAVDDQADVPALQGWRRTVFGADALRLKQGQVALALDGDRVQLVPLTDA